MAAPPLQERPSLAQSVGHVVHQVYLEDLGALLEVEDDVLHDGGKGRLVVGSEDIQLRVLLLVAVVELLLKDGLLVERRRLENHVAVGPAKAEVVDADVLLIPRPRPLR